MRHPHADLAIRSDPIIHWIGARLWPMCGTMVAAACRESPRKVGTMIIGIPKETERLEHRVGLTPFAVRRLSQQGHTALVEKEAGAAGHFTDRDYTGAGAEVVYTAEEVYKRADLVCQVGGIFPHE